ncbi:uncharacterized protein [Lolium perenne]|uniref:uncharacterized protein n=1 Tax=Lolium perenne TaxID=4522 RepID=UPI003A9A2B63
MEMASWREGFMNRRANHHRPPAPFSSSPVCMYVRFLASESPIITRTILLPLPLPLSFPLLIFSSDRSRLKRDRRKKKEEEGRREQDQQRSCRSDRFFSRHHRFLMAGTAAVPKFGSWDAENIGYTVFFEKVRENKTAPVPATAAAAPKGHDDYEFDPYEHYENLSRKAASRPASSHGQSHGHAAPAQYYDNPSRNAPSRPASSHGQAAPAQYYDNPSRNPPSRPASSQGHGHPAPQQHYPGQHGNGGYHRRNGSNGSSAASEVSSRGSKFSPPRPYQPRYGNNNSGGSYPQPQQQYAAPAPRHHQHQHAAPAPRVAASPPRHAPPPVNERRPGQVRAAKAPSAVPRFGVWDEQNAAQGFTVQFEKVQRQREVAKVAAPEVPPPRQQLSPDRAAPTWGRPLRKPKKSFLSKVYRCLFPVVRH